MRKVIIDEGSYSGFKPSSRDVQKMREYYAKGSNPKTLANTVKDRDKALARYHIAVASKWEACEKSFYDRCLELGVLPEYLDIVKRKALKDTEIYLGDIEPKKKETKQVTKVSTPSGKRPEPQKNISTRKMIDADTGFIITGKSNTPFS